MPESQGISRRDLLKRGAALGGAVVWATPVVQTLGMGRAFAQNATPVIEFSYVGILATGPSDKIHFLKWEVDEDTWEHDPGMTPGCSPGIQSGDYEVKGFGEHAAWPHPIPVSATCLRFSVPENWTVHYWVAKQGQLPCVDSNGKDGTVLVGPGQFLAGMSC